MANQQTTLADKKAHILARIAELREMEARATAGPWLYLHGAAYYLWPHGVQNRHNLIADIRTEENAELIKSARNQFRVSLDIQEAFVRQELHHFWVGDSCGRCRSHGVEMFDDKAEDCPKHPNIPLIDKLYEACGGKS